MSNRPRGRLLAFPKSDPWSPPRWRQVRIPRLPQSAAGIRELERIVVRFAKRGWRLLRALDENAEVGMEDLTEGPVLTLLAVDGAWLDLLCHFARHEVTVDNLDSYADDVRRLGREQALLRRAIYDELSAELRDTVAASEQAQGVDPMEIRQAVVDMVLALEDEISDEDTWDDDFGRPLRLGRPEPLAEVNATRRSEWEARSLPAKGGLRACLRSLPVDWLDGVCHALGLRIDGRRHMREAAIAQLLQDSSRLLRIVDGLPRTSLAALHTLLQHDGCCSARELTRAHGSDRQDPWFWREQPPRSPLGQLRQLGLVFVGSADLGMGEERAVLVPTELRPLLRTALGSLER